MNIFKTARYTWWQIGIFKLALLSIGVAIGASFPDVFLPYVTFLVVLGIVLGIYISAVWVRQN